MHEAKQKTELIFLLTPRIVRKTSELRVIVPPAELERLEGTRAKPEEPCAGGCRPIPYRFPGFSTKDPK
jgi:hypothetical protein